MAYLSFICRLLLALVFFVAVATKVRGRSDLAQFRAAVREFGVGLPWSSAASGAVIAGELVAASLMLIDAVAPVGLGLAAVLLAAFTGAIGSAVRRGATTSCRCFGASDQPLGVRHVVRNVILLSITAAGMTGTLLAPGGVGGLDVTALFLSGFVAVVLATLVIAYDDLVALVLVR
ncbi:MauE/DoxX family redox-associated membrane protein [Streptosporangium sp. NPDC051023]|uniref:MauE/DoxX family redox-associated membrane protein n=1 Tax=Streptosporangium sp. NPDC051023 TaxID=3155410 RepID=UPI00344DC083